MSHLRIYSDTDGSVPLWQGSDQRAIAEKLNAAGVRFEQWHASLPLSKDADDAAVKKAYAADIERIQQEGGYGTVDVLRVLPDNPQREALRAKFLEEHTHSEDEVRFFVEGSGMFYLHIGGNVYMVLCERGDLISVPDGTPHWFDLGEAPHFTAIRFFTESEGWVARYTGERIAARFPKFEKAAA
jgi:1,2-dihydroxy-3-keto-5-methylthiopentene dioxygenase